MTIVAKCDSTGNGAASFIIETVAAAVIDAVRIIAMHVVFGRINMAILLLAY